MKKKKIYIYKSRDVKKRGEKYRSIRYFVPSLGSYSSGSVWFPFYIRIIYTYILHVRDIHAVSREPITRNGDHERAIDTCVFLVWRREAGVDLEEESCSCQQTDVSFIYLFFIMPIHTQRIIDLTLREWIYKTIVWDKMFPSYSEM